MTRRGFFRRVGAMGLALVPGLAWAAPRRAREQEIKLAYLYNLVRFTRWPEGVPAEGEPFRFGLWGGDPFGTSWDDLALRRVGGRPAEAVRVRNPAEALRCHALFLVEEDGALLGRMLEAVRGRPVLTVGDAPGFVDRGGMVGFVHRDGRIRFEINVGAMRRSGLRMSADVLRLAARVVGLEGKGDVSLP
ncbi:MAG: YfiR family protein [Candidatus Dadabacteria bacterium]|nr:MAG: YfiR family protein [Candidatus Dadabacteria bacterium]